MFSSLGTLITQCPEAYDKLEGEPSPVVNLQYRIDLFEVERKKKEAVISSLSDTDKNLVLEDIYPYLAIPMSREKVVNNHQFIIKLINSILKVKLNDYHHESIVEEIVVLEGRKLYSNYTKRPASWNKKYIK